MAKDSDSVYQSAVNMRIAESQIQWARYSAILVVNTIFIGLLGFTYSKEFAIPIIIQQLLPLLGIVLCLLWFRMTKRGFMWVKFWTDMAREIEEKGGDRNRLKPFVKGLKHKNSSEVIINTS